MSLWARSQNSLIQVIIPTSEFRDRVPTGGESFHSPLQSMKIIKLSTVTAVLSFVCVLNSSTVANAQGARRIEFPKTCSNEFINRGGRSNDPNLALQKALLSWNRLAQQRGYFTFKGAKNPKINVNIYPSVSQGEVIWKANVIGHPCKFMQLRRN